MTPQEQKMLDDLMARVDSTRLDDKDPEAAQRIEEWSARNPDAAYILAQTVLVQSYALEQAKAQIQSLQQQMAQHPALPQQAKPASFLGNLFGHKDEQRPPQPAPAYAQPQPQQGYTPVPQYAGAQQYGQGTGYPPPSYGAPQGYPPVGGGGSSFLRSAATTAAGVAAGALAFEGIESLMHGFGHTAGFGGYGGGGLGEFGGRPEETVINNYYDSPAPGAGNPNAEIQQFAHEGDSSLNPQQDLASDVNVEDNGGTQLQADTDLPNIDDNAGSYDDASLDDGGSFDDSSDNS
ncbi:MAG: uncharacterized protein QOK38_2491 [Acidobacteriaceae bacterium]|jgi:hypothetical protein|nr:uncharacterized protein [Acidobacteriaceae bacterium]